MSENSLQIDDLDTGRHTELTCLGNALAFSPDGKKLAVARSQEVLVLDVASDKTVAQVDVPPYEVGVPRECVPRYVTSLAYSPKDDLIAIGNSRDEIAFWRVGEGDVAEVDFAPRSGGLPVGIVAIARRIVSGVAVRLVPVGSVSEPATREAGPNKRAGRRKSGHDYVLPTVSISKSGDTLPVSKSKSSKSGDTLPSKSGKCQFS